MNVQNLKGVDIMKKYSNINEYFKHIHEIEDEEQIEYLKQWQQKHNAEKESEHVKNALAMILVIIVLMIIFWQFFFL